MFSVRIRTNGALVARVNSMGAALRKARALSAVGYPVAVEAASGARFFF